MARQYHWWIIGRDEYNKPYLIYGAPDYGSAGGEDVARSKAFEIMGGLDFELKRLATRNLSTARGFVCGGFAESGKGLRESARRLGHEKSLDRLRRRRLARRP